MKRSPLLPIFLVVLVDVLGFTIVYPLLAIYAETFGASALVAMLLASVYALCSLISTPIIGRLSDQYGRRRLLLVSQAGTFAGFIILGVSNALWMVFLGRILDGITAGNLSTAQAYISDHTKPENRARSFGIIGIAFGVGFTLGPVLAGALQGYGLHVPFLVAAGLSATSMVCSYTLLEPGVANAPTGGEAGPGGRRPAVFDLQVYLDFFRRPRVGALLLQFFLYTFAFSAFMSGFALFSERRFLTSDGHPWTPREVAFVFMYTGLLGAIIQGGILGRLVKRLGEAKLALIGFAALVIAYIGLGFTATVAMLIPVATVAAFGNGVVRPSITSELTQCVGRREQGVVLGISGSLSSLAMMLAPPVGGLLLDQAGTPGSVDARWLTAWAFVPAIVGALGLIAAMVTRRQKSADAAGANLAKPAEDAP